MLSNYRIGITHGFFALKVQREMAEMGLTLNELSEATGHTYEHVRKAVNGYVLPSKQLVRAFSKVLRVPCGDLQDRANADEMLVHYGPLVWELAGKKPERAPLYLISEYLTAEQRDEILAWARLVAKRRKAERLKKN